jgi:hypothetical protein
VSAAIAALAACVALIFGWLATKEGSKAVAEAVIARKEAERERKRWRYERVAEINEEIYTKASDLKGSGVQQVDRLRPQLNHMRALVVLLKDSLPYAYAVPEQGTTDGVVREAGEARHQIVLAIKALDEPTAEAVPRKGLLDGLGAWVRGART